MDGVKELSAEGAAEVYAEYEKARRKLEEARTEKPPDDWCRSGGPGRQYAALLNDRGADELRIWDYAAFLNFVATVFLKYGIKAIEQAEQGKWKVDRACWWAEEVFLISLFAKASDEEGRDRRGKKFPHVILGTWASGPYVDPKVMEWLRRTEEWHQYGRAIEALPEKITARTTQAMPADPVLATRPSKRKRSKPSGSGKAEPKQGYRAEIHEWMDKNGISTVKEAARGLHVTKDVLQNIMSDVTPRRYSYGTLEGVLKKIREPKRG
jgi:hypothetical protein